MRRCSTSKKNREQHINGSQKPKSAGFAKKANQSKNVASRPLVPDKIPQALSESDSEDEPHESSNMEVAMKRKVPINQRFECSTTWYDAVQPCSGAEDFEARESFNGGGSDEELQDYRHYFDLFSTRDAMAEEVEHTIDSPRPADDDVMLDKENEIDDDQESKEIVNAPTPKRRTKSQGKKTSFQKQQVPQIRRMNQQPPSVASVVPRSVPSISVSKNSSPSPHVLMPRSLEQTGGGDRLNTSQTKSDGDPAAAAAAAARTCPEGGRHVPRPAPGPSWSASASAFSPTHFHQRRRPGGGGPDRIPRVCWRQPEAAVAAVRPALVQESQVMWRRIELQVVVVRVGERGAGPTRGSQSLCHELITSPGCCRWVIDGISTITAFETHLTRLSEEQRSEIIRLGAMPVSGSPSVFQEMVYTGPNEARAPMVHQQYA
jgi:hypothetical protein